ncbi:hypothetical protein MTO96_026737 [Rhipicephalus appendiculatus]
MPGRRHPVLAFAGTVPHLTSPSPRAQLRFDGFFSLPDLQLVERDGQRTSLGQPGLVEDTAATATRSDNVTTTSTKTAQSHVVPPTRTRSPPLQVVKRRIPISAPLQLSYVKEGTRDVEGGPLATSTKPQAPTRKSKQSKLGSRNTRDRLKSMPWPTNPVNLDATVPLEVQVVAAQVTATVTNKEDHVQSSLNRSLYPVLAGMRRAECDAAATEAAVPAPDYITGGDKITESSQQQVCVLSIEGGSVAWSKRSAVPRSSSKRGECPTPGIEAANQASSWNAEKHSESAMAKEQRSSGNAATSGVKTMPLFILLGGDVYVLLLGDARDQLRRELRHRATGLLPRAWASPTALPKAI